MKVPISCVLFFLKSILTSHLNHSSRIRNDQVMAKLLKMVQNKMTEHLWYRYHFVWYRYHPSKMPRNGGFSPIFPYFSTQTNSIINIHIKTTLYPSCNLCSTQFIFQILILLQKPFMNYSQNNSNMGHNPYTNQTQGLVRVYSNPNNITLQLNHESNLKWRIPCFSCTI